MNAVNRPSGAVGSSAAPGLSNEHNPSTFRRRTAARNRLVPTKESRVLSCLAERAYDSRELSRLAHDSCPHSTIAELRRKGFEIDTAMIRVPGYGGTTARIARYTLADSCRAKALSLVAGSGG